MKKTNIIYLALALLGFILFFSSCSSSKCSLGYCSIEQKKLQSYNDYKKINRKQYTAKVSKLETKYIDIKPKQVNNNTAILNPKFR